MSLYGYKEMIDGRIGTYVVSADTVEEYSEWCEVVKDQTNGNFEEIYTSNFMDALRDDRYKGYKHPVLVVYHTTDEQREAFWTEWSIIEVASAVGRDRQADMLHAKKEEIRIATETEEDRARTIEERTGLDKHDPWDRRTDEEREQDAEMKKKIKELREKGELSGDSFGGAGEQRASRTRNNNVPGAYSRTQALDALKSFQDPNDTTDYDAMSNEELKEALQAAGVPDIKGVFEDNEVPQKAMGDGDIMVTQVRGDTKDGIFEIEDIVAHKIGGDVDEVTKAANDAARKESINKATGGTGKFKPEDFAAALRGDGSADAAAHAKGDNRKTRQADEAPVFSPEAQAAREEHARREREEMKNRRAQHKREADIKAKGERDRGIFKGADLVDEDEEKQLWDNLPEKLRDMLEEAGLVREEVMVKDYPYNSELGGRALLPFDGLRVENGMRILGGVNIDIEGTMSMNDAAVAVVSRKETTEEGWAIYARRRKMIQVSEPNEAPVDPKSEVDIWLVRIR